MDQRDWDALVAVYASGHVFDDRRSLVRTRVEGEAYFAHLRMMFRDWGQGSVHVLATRGDRLALSRQTITSVARDRGPAEFEMLNVIEVDADGRRIAIVTFDPNDLDAAYAELDARFDAGEGVSSGTQMKIVARDRAARDWDALAARLAPEIVVYDHRPVGWPTLRGPQAYIEMLKTLVDLAPDARHRADHVRVCGRKDLIVTTLRGTREGGAFEDQRVLVAEGDDQGRVRRIDFYTLEQLDEARARYDAPADAVEGRPMTPSASPLGKGRTEEGSPSTPRIENAATRSMHRFKDALEARDWERVAAVLAPEFRYLDHRTMMHLDLDQVQYLEFLRPNWQMSSAGLTQEILATRGNRLALLRSHFEGSDHTIGPSEIEFLAVAQVNDHGVRLATVVFDPDDLDAAYAELDARYAAGEAAPYARASETLRRIGRAGAARDWEAMASVFDPNLVFKDHRLIGWGTLHSRDEYVARIRALVDLAPDVTLRLDHVLGHDDRGAFAIGRWAGSREGGAFEIPFVAVGALGADGHIQRIDTYDLDQLDAARARFAELVLSSVEGLQPDPLRIPPNAAPPGRK